MEEQVQKILRSFSFHLGLSMDVLQSLGEEQLGLTVGKNMGTIGEQFRHIGRVITQYTEAIENKRIDKTKEYPNVDIAKSKKELIAYLDGAYKRLESLLGSMNEEELINLVIDWSYWKDKPMGIVPHLAALINHQSLHNGELIVYLKAHEISFPSSWKAWGL